MTIYFNMLSSLMEYRIRSNMKGNLVVTLEFCWDWCLNSDFHQELMKPHDLTYGLAIALYLDSALDRETTLMFLTLS